MKKINLIISTIALLVFFVFIPQTTQAKNNIYFIPAVSIPGSQFIAGQQIELDNSTKTICDYIAAIYKYAIGIVAIFAAVSLIIGGAIWVTSGGSPSRISEAKSWIIGSLVGLVLALGAFLILATINRNLVICRHIIINPLDGTLSIQQLKTKYSNISCGQVNHDQNGKFIMAFLTGYCQPKAKDYSDRNKFLCAVGLNCSCPKGRDKTNFCKGKKLNWHPCFDFNDKTVKYCNSTASGTEPGPGQVAADWSCYKKGTKLKIAGKDYVVTDKGSAIKGARFDVWFNNCADALKITGLQKVYIP